MTTRISTKSKWLAALGLMAVFVPLSVYVHAPDRSVPALLNRLWPDLILVFVLSTAATVAWIGLAEWLQGQLRRYFGDFFLNPKRSLPYLATALFFGLTTLTLAIAGTALYHTIFHTAPGIAPFTLRVVYAHAAALSLCIFVLLSNRYVLEHLHTIECQAEKLEKENVQSRFNALQSQVNPHFLFNSMSILSSLVKSDPERSELFIDRLSKAYRYILEQREIDLAPLKQELEFLKSYTFLLQTRFEHKFEVRVQLDEATIENSRIPPLTLQMLVENAVKHNRMSEKEPLCITIEIADAYLLVRNPYRPRGENAASTGMGLQNIFNRYSLLTDLPVWAGEKEDEFIVRLPCLPESKR